MKFKNIIMSFIFFSLVSCANGFDGGLELNVIWQEGSTINPIVSGSLIGATDSDQKISPEIITNSSKIVINKIKPGDYIYNFVLQEKLSDTNIVTILEKKVSVRIDAIVTSKYYFTLSEKDFTVKPLYPPMIIVDDIPNADGTWGVTLTTLSTNADIYWTLDADPTVTPDTAGTKYTSKLNLNDGPGLVLRCVTKKDGWTTSDFAIPFNFEQVDKPVVENITADVHQDALSYKATINTAGAQPGEEIYWTIDGSMPTTLSTKYSSQVESNKHNQTVTFRAKRKNYLFSDAETKLTRKLFAVDPKPTFGEITPNGANKNVNINIPTPPVGVTNFNYYYTLDGVFPSATNNGTAGAYVAGTTAYTIIIGETETLSFRCVATDYLPSDVLQKASSKCATPIFVDIRTDYRNPLKVKITEDNVPPIKTYYNSNSVANPTNADTLYTAPFDVPIATNNLKALTISESGRDPSAVAEQVIDTAVTPTIVVEKWNVVKIETTTPFAKIYWTTNGAEPNNPASSLFNNDLIPWETATATGPIALKAMATATMHHNSTVANKSIQICATPVIADARTGGNAGYINKLEVTMTTATAGAEMSYTRYASESPYGDVAKRVLYDSPTLQINTNEFIKVAATGVDLVTSQIAEIDGTPLVKPVVSINNLNQCTITSVDTTASIIYRINGGAWTNYAAPFTIQKNNILDVYAVKELRNPSEKVTVNLSNQVQKPTIVDDRTDLRQPLKFLISPTATGGVKYFYSIANPAVDPNPGAAGVSELIDAHILPGNTNGVLSVRGAKDGSLMSEIATVNIIRLTAPTVTLEANNVLKIQAAAADTTNPAVTELSIFYTIDGTDPKTNGIKLTTESVKIPFTTTDLKARVFVSARNCLTSNEATLNVTTKTAKPDFTDSRVAPNGLRSLLKIKITIPTGSTVKYAMVDSATFDATEKLDYVANTEIEIPTGTSITAYSTKTGELVSEIATMTGTKLTAPDYHLMLNNTLRFTKDPGDTAASIHYSFDEGATWTTTYTEGTYTAPLALNNILNVIVVEALKNPSDIISNNFNSEALDVAMADSRKVAVRSDYRQNFVVSFTGNSGNNSIYYIKTAENPPTGTPTAAVELTGAGLIKYGNEGSTLDKTVYTASTITYFSYDKTKLTKVKTQMIKKAELPTFLFSNVDRMMTINSGVDTAYYTEYPSAVSVKTTPIYYDGISRAKKDCVFIYTAPFTSTTGKLSAVASGEFKIVSEQASESVAAYPTPRLLDARKEDIANFPGNLRGFTNFTLIVEKPNDTGGDPTVEPVGFYRYGGSDPNGTVETKSPASGSFLVPDGVGPSPFKSNITVNFSTNYQIFKVAIAKTGFFLSDSATVTIGQAKQPIIDINDNRKFVILPAEGETSTDTYYYFTDDDTDINNATLFTGTTPNPAENSVIRAYTVRPFNFQSPTAETTLTKCDIVVFDQANLTNYSAFNLTISCATPNSYLVVNGIKVANPHVIPIDSTTTITVFANKVGMFPSDSETRTYTMKVATPDSVLTQDGTQKKITMSTTTQGAIIHYKKNGGAEQTAGGNSEIVNANTGDVFEFWGIKTGWENSSKVTTTIN